MVTAAPAAQIAQASSGLLFELLIDLRRLFQPLRYVPSGDVSEAESSVDGYVKKRLGGAF